VLIPHPMMFTREQIEAKMHAALEILQQKDASLLENDVNERSLTHKLAEYLQKEFLDYHVDCEYNRMTDDNGVQIVKRFPPESVMTDDTKGKTVYPDIIVHDRSSRDRNLLILEVKKHADRQEKQRDVEKLRMYIDSLHYEHAYFIDFSDSSCISERV